MANTTLANLKIKALRRAGNYYNSSDSVLLELSGGIINDCLAHIQSVIGPHPYCIDLGNTTNTVASQAYVDLADTDIIDIINVTQRTTDTKLTRITWDEYKSYMSDPTRWTGVADMAYCPVQALNASGVNIWSIYFVPTPSAAIAVYYDYIKNIAFSSDTADSSYCPLPTMFDDWICAEFKPRFYQVIDSENFTKYRIARAEADMATSRYRLFLSTPSDYKPQLKAFDNGELTPYTRVNPTTVP